MSYIVERDADIIQHTLYTDADAERAALDVAPCSVVEVCGKYGALSAFIWALHRKVCQFSKDKAVEYAKEHPHATYKTFAPSACARVYLYAASDTLKKISVNYTLRETAYYNLDEYVAPSWEIIHSRDIWTINHSAPAEQYALHIIVTSSAEQASECRKIAQCENNDPFIGRYAAFAIVQF